MSDIKVMNWPDAASALHLVTGPQGGAVVVTGPQPGDWVEMASVARRLADSKGLLPQLRDLGDRLVLEFRPAVSGSRPGRKPAPLTERLRAMVLGEEEKVPVGEVDMPAMRSLVSRVNRDLGPKGIMLRVRAAKGASVNHSIEAIKLPRRHADRAAAAAVAVVANVDEDEAF